MILKGFLKRASIILVVLLASLGLMLTCLSFKTRTSNTNTSHVFADAEIVRTITDTIDHDGWFELVDPEIENLTYMVTSETEVFTVEVFAGDECSGDVIIPNKVNYNSHLYTVTGIGSDAFYGIGNSISSIVLSNSITYIDNTAFAHATYNGEIVIPNSVINIADAAFLGATNIVLHFESTTPATLGQDALGGVARGYVSKIQVPKNSKTTYLQSSAWQVYEDLIEEYGDTTNTGIIADIILPSIIILTLTTVLIYISLKNKNKFHA